MEVDFLGVILTFTGVYKVFDMTFVAIFSKNDKGTDGFKKNKIHRVHFLISSYTIR